MASTVVVSREDTDAIDPIEQALIRSESTFRSPRMRDADGTDAVTGVVRWKPVKSLWLLAMTGIALIAGPLFVTWGAVALFVATTAVTVCLGHSLGMHRRLIHRAYDCPLWVERLSSISAPSSAWRAYGMICQHDIRDWAQRSRSAIHLAHRCRCCAILLAAALRPAFRSTRRNPLSSSVANDPFYRFIEKTDYAAASLAPLCFAIGGLPWGHLRAGCDFSHWALLFGYLPTIATALVALRARACRDIMCAMRLITMARPAKITSYRPPRASASARMRSIRAGGACVIPASPVDLKISSISARANLSASR